MDAKISQHIEEAERIRTSGRWKAIAEEVNAWANQTDDSGNKWFVELLAGLGNQIYGEYSALVSAYNLKEPKDPALIAWRARNLLELSIWASYFASNRDNARRLYEDAGRDVKDLTETFLKWGKATGQSSDWLEPLQREKDDVTRRAAAEGIESLDGKYTQVARAAEECGLKEQYVVYYKLLSKFTHPTAMQILGISDEAKQNLQRDYFFSQGCLFYAAAIKVIEKVLEAR
jgi:hypothetical protein